MLKMDNIEFIKELTKDGITYKYFVKLKNNEYRIYVNREKNGQTIVKEYNKNDLPKTIQKYINNKIRVETNDSNDQDNFKCYIYK